ncbi:MAG TPA: hypothetical protein ENN60_03845 [archaeon]|nr:hypothetical protein [archaeon]
MNLLYAIYALVIGGVDINAGLKLVKREGWEQWVGFSALAVGGVALIAGVQALLGFYVDPLLLLIPLVGAGTIILIESWRQVRAGRGFWGVLIALYNTFAWVVNLLHLFYLLQGRRRR